MEGKKTITMNQFWKLLGWDDAWAWLTFAEKFPGKAEEAWKQREEHKENIIDNMTAYEIHKSYPRGKLVDICNKMPKNITLYEKKLLMNYTVFFDKLLFLFGEDVIIEDISQVYHNATEESLIVQIANMVLDEWLIDEYISLKLEWEEINKHYRDKYHAQQVVHKFNYLTDSYETPV